MLPWPIGIDDLECADAQGLKDVFGWYIDRATDQDRALHWLATAVLFNGDFVSRLRPALGDELHDKLKAICSSLEPMPTIDMEAAQGLFTLRAQELYRAGRLKLDEAKCRERQAKTVAAWIKDLRERYPDGMTQDDIDCETAHLNHYFGEEIRRVATIELLRS